MSQGCIAPESPKIALLVYKFVYVGKELKLNNVYIKLYTENKI